MMLMLFHPNAGAAKGHALRFQAEALFQSIFAGKGDLAARPDYAMPRESTSVSKGPHYLPCGSRKSRGLCDLSVSGHLALGDLANHFANHVEHDLN